MAMNPDAFPETVSPEVRTLMEEMIHLSNSASTHTEHEKDEAAFANLFTNDGIYEFAGKQGVGHKGIHDFREQLFANIPHRDHPIHKVYTFGKDYLDLMAFGSVDYVHHDKSTHSDNWAARYFITKDESGQVKFKHIQIILQPAHGNEK